MADTPIGTTLDRLGVTVDLAPDDLVTDAVVLIKVVQADGTVTMSKGRSEGMDWITALGLITAASTTENAGFHNAE